MAAPSSPSSTQGGSAERVDTRHDGRSDHPSPVDWDLAEAVATRVCGSTRFQETQAAVTMPAELRSLTHLAQDLVEDFTGLRSGSGPVRAEVIDRPDWIRANIASFRHLVDPIARRLSEPGDDDGDRPPRILRWSAPIRPGHYVGSKALGVELGLLLGFVAQRVLGQYDVILPPDDSPGDSHGDSHGDGDGDGGRAGEGVDGVVYYVGPNIHALETRHGFSPRDFRLWIALHEVTHRTQFTAVPWLRPYFLELVDETLDRFDIDAAGFADMVQQAIDRVRGKGGGFADDGLLRAFATDEQRADLDRITALMTLLEGHGNWVMDVLGADHVHGQARMAATLARRRKQRGLSNLVMRLMGMDMKAKQYEEGQRFVEAVVAESGNEGLNLAWRSRESLPVLPEIRGGVSDWLERSGALIGAAAGPDRGPDGEPGAPGGADGPEPG